MDDLQETECAARKVDAAAEELRKLVFQLSPAGQIVALIEDLAQRAYDLNQRYGLDSTATLLLEVADMQKKYSMTLEDDVSEAADDETVARSDVLHDRRVDDALTGAI